MTNSIAAPNSTSGSPRSKRRHTLLLAGIAHALHDGYTDIIYVLLPVWQVEFGLDYAVLGLLRTLYSGTMAGLQVSAGSFANRFGSRIVLALGTALASFGYLLAGFSGSLTGLCVALALAGAGSSTQHPIGSAAVSRAYGSKARGPLGIYNFSGDLGKATLPVAASLLLTLMHWRSTLRIVATIGFIVAVSVAVFMPNTQQPSEEKGESSASSGMDRRGGFPLLLVIGVLDSAVRMGFLIFLPFLLKAKSATLPMVGIALSLVFVGGAMGKFACGWIGARIGVLWTVLVTEGGTAAAILLVVTLPLTPTLVVLPLLGIMLNGTSSVLYGTVPELTTPDNTERSFALFYTGTIGSGAIAPLLFGMLGDAIGVSWATVMTAATALAILPIAVVLAPRLESD
jgi:MFS transporter, FSR family, fosmidomycin resistance protein